ncbi:MAG: DUF2520 domain-containing protein, partial [Actinomycetota bacterium]
DRPGEVLGPLASATVANAVGGGGGGATLTGPVVRGEAATVRRHLEALGSFDPSLAASYVRVSDVVLGAALRAGRLNAASAAELEEVLRPWR